MSEEGLLPEIKLGRYVNAEGHVLARGALGITAYLGHLADVVFKNSLLFPFALSLLGVGVIAAGLLYHRKQEAISAWLAANLPKAVLRLRPAHAR